MYLEYFGLKEAPFSIAPNPRYLYLTHQHQEALAHLIYGLRGEGGVILLTGEVGTGKTTISRKLLEDLPEKIDIAWVINPKLSAMELLATILDEFSVPYDKNQTSIKVFTDLLSTYLIQAHGEGRDTVVMVDEAQNLSPEVLEQLRLLTNLETNERKLLQIVLLGQPELKTMLERHELRQLAQRITARYHLTPLGRFECGEYIRHRLSVAGCSLPLFSSNTINLIHKESQGTPRVINLLCDRILLGLYGQGCREARTEHVRQAAIEVLGECDEQKSRALLPPLVSATAIITVAITAAFYFQMLGTEKITSLVLPTHAKKLANPEVSGELREVASEAQQSSNNPLLPKDAETYAEEMQQPANEEVAMPASLFSSDPWAVIEKTGTKALAFRTLADIWQTELLPADDINPCDQLVDKKLFCLEQPANVWMLRKLNRPVIFQVAGSNGHDRFAVIRSIEGEHATVQLDLQQWEIDLNELEERRQQHVSLIWIKPPGYEKYIREGDSGETVQWLTSQLDRIQGKMIPPNKSLNMDRLLLDRLKDFQKSQGIPADGIAGPLTLIRINERIGLSPPKLSDRGNS